MLRRNIYRSLLSVMAQMNVHVVMMKQMSFVKVMINIMDLTFIVLLLSQTSVCYRTMETAHTMSSVFHGNHGLMSAVNALRDIHGITAIVKVIFCSHLILIIALGAHAQRELQCLCVSLLPHFLPLGNKIAMRKVFCSNDLIL